jgi:hypothetical protein
MSTDQPTAEETVRLTYTGEDCVPQFAEAPQSTDLSAPPEPASTDAPTTRISSEPADADGEPQPRRRHPLRRLRFWLGALVVVLLIGGWTLAGHVYLAHDRANRAEERSRAALTDLNSRLADITRERDGLRAREDELGRREAALRAREGAVQRREDALTQAERTVAQSTIREGTWAVGVDIEPGTYRTRETVAGSCYWGIYADANGTNIVANNVVTGGRPTVSLSAGQYFTTSRCGEWTKV